MPSKVIVSGITFDNSQNIENLRETIFATIQLLKDNGFETTSRIVSFQNENSIIDFDHRGHDRRRRKKGRVLLTKFFSGHHGVDFTAPKIFIASTFNRKQLQSRSGPEYAWKQLNLTGKHIFLWQDFLESESEYLVVFEDDVSKNADSDLNLGEVFKVVSGIQYRPIFVNLVHQFNLRGQAITQELEYSNKSIYFTKVFANTTGAYLVNRQMAALLFEAILVNPELRVMGADWLVGLLAEKFPQITDSLCINVEPGIYNNQSLNNFTSSLEN